MVRPIIDTNCRFGYDVFGSYCRIETTEQMIADMDRYGIRKALVYHLSALHNPVGGNVFSLRQTTEIPVRGRLYPVFVIAPNCWNTQSFADDVKAFADRIAAHYTAVLLVFQEKINPVISKKLDELFERLSAYRMPVMLDYGVPGLYSYQPNWSHLLDFLSAYPAIPAILVNAGYNFELGLYDFAERFPNLYMEISGYQGNGQVEQFCRTFSSERLLYGSRYPALCPGAALYKVDTSELSDDEKMNILYRNAETLFGLGDGK